MVTSMVSVHLAQHLGNESCRQHFYDSGSTAMFATSTAAKHATVVGMGNGCTQEGHDQEKAFWLSSQQPTSQQLHCDRDGGGGAWPKRNWTQQ
ncbi:hypothetical protein TNCV_2999711 [Trichonephila clavipes]|nr:hypothetical protein TNCV_2999711 [Trichonephila clavipes]